MGGEDARAALCRSRRIVLKIGSKALSSDRTLYGRLAQEILSFSAEKRRFVVVSSGAIALGMAKLGIKTRPKEMAWLQASAAAGQSVLMRHYEEAFMDLGVPVAQILLTHSDLANRTRANNARAALAALLEAGAIPIINENDTVSVDEIRFGDNDQLASLVVPLVDADLLILLSDVPGLLNGDERVRMVRDIEQEAKPLAGKSVSGVGIGGMASKVEAARKASYAGAHVVIADARVTGIISSIVRGDDVGTWFLPNERRLSARRHWIAFTLRPRGALLLDTGATEAIAHSGKSLLAIGILGVRGDFRQGDAVSLLAPDGHEIGRGLVRLSAAETARIAAKKRDTEHDQPIVVHRDDLVVLG